MKGGLQWQWRRAPVRELRSASRCAGGFTLIEAMVVVALLAIVSALAAPSFRSFIGTMNAKATAFDLISDLTMARSEAIKRNRTVTVEPVDGDWSKGWEITVDGVDESLREHAALASALAIGGEAPASVQFRPNGRLAEDTADDNQAWSITSSIDGVTARCVVITPTGAARSKTKTGEC